MNEKLITLKEIQDMVGFKKDYIYRRIKDETFPKQVNFGTRSVRWKLSEIQKWINDQK